MMSLGEKVAGGLGEGQKKARQKEQRETKQMKQSRVSRSMEELSTPTMGAEVEGATA